MISTNIIKYKILQIIFTLNKMIPKIIHYCWFGQAPLPQAAKRCIASWHKYFPEYEIKEWNEDNFNINMVPFIREAYSLKICICKRLCKTMDII